MTLVYTARAAQAVDRPASALGYGFALIIVGEPVSDARSKPGRVIHLSGPAGAVEGGIDIGEIPHMRTVQDSGAELYRLDRVLPAVFHQRSAHEDYRRQPIDQAELAHGVGHIDLRACVR